MLLVSDVHDGFDALRRVAAMGEPLLVLGDLLNFIDYRTGEGMVSEILGRGFATEVAEARGRGTDVRGLWHRALTAYPGDFRAEVLELADRQYREAFAAMDGAEVYVTHGNVDIVPLLAEHAGRAHILDGEVVEIEGWRVGFVGGTGRSLFDLGVERPLAARLAGLGPVDILCTHVAPAVPALADDVITGRPERSSVAVLDYLVEYRPPFHYFGDIHQPRAHRWRIGPTLSRNLGYFRATGRATRHPARAPGRYANSSKQPPTSPVNE